jgi:hypothetical protein
MYELEMIHVSITQQRFQRPLLAALSIVQRGAWRVSPFSTMGAQAVVKGRSRFWRSMFGTGDAVIVVLGARMAAFSIVAVFLRSSFEDVEM